MLYGSYSGDRHDAESPVCCFPRRPRFIWWETVLQVETLILVTVEVLGRGMTVLYQVCPELGAGVVGSVFRTPHGFAKAISQFERRSLALREMP